MKNEETLFLFAKAIKSLIKKQPLDKITVTDIVSTAGKTRQTFYRHFQDKYDLVIYVADFDTASNYTVRRVEWIKLMAANAPWFVQDIPTLFISLANPYHLLDVPMIKTFEEMNQGGSLQEALNLKFAFIEQEHAFFKEAFKSNDYNNLIHYDFCCIYDFYKNYIYKNTGKTLSSDIDFLLNMYCRGSVDMTVDWVL